MSSAVRATLATALRVALPDGWTVYPWPHTLAGARSAIIGAGSPYRAPITFNAINEQCRLRVTLLFPVPSDAPSFDILDGVVTDCIAAVEAIDNMAYTQADIPGLVTNNTGAEYMAATIDVWSV